MMISKPYNCQGHIICEDCFQHLKNSGGTRRTRKAKKILCVTCKKEYCGRPSLLEKVLGLHDTNTTISSDSESDWRPPVQYSHQWFWWKLFQVTISMPDKFNQKNTVLLPLKTFICCNWWWFSTNTFGNFCASNVSITVKWQVCIIVLTTEIIKIECSNSTPWFIFNSLKALKRSRTPYPSFYLALLFNNNVDKK